jgi:hypothetical protein
MTSSSTRGGKEGEEGEEEGGGGMVVVSERTRERGALHFSDDEADVVRKREFNFYQRASSSSRAGGRGRRKRKGKGGGGRILFRAKNDGKSFLFSLFWVVFFFVVVVVSPARWSEVRGETTTTTTTTLAERLDVCALNLLDDVNSTVNSNFNTRLEGLTLNVAAIWDPGYVSIEGEAAPTRTKDYPDVYCTNCGSRLSGYNFDVFEKMATLGNFKTNWTIFGDVDSSRGETYEDMALNFTRDFDVSGQWWSDTARRRSIGISCGYYHTDITRILTVSKQAGSGGKIDLFSFLAPLSWQVWLTLISFLLGYALLYLFFERPHFNLPTFKASVARSLFLSFECLTGGFVAEPVTKTGMVLQSVFSFCTLGFSSLYTAALTSILIEEAVSAMAINTLDDLQQAGGRAIMFTGDPLKPRILAQNPWIIATDVARSEILATKKIDDLLGKYGSQAVILSSADAGTLVQQATYCDASANGIVLAAGGGFITNYEDCHSDITHVFDTILLGMEADGVLDEILNKYSKDTCDATASATKIDYTIALDKTAGIFIVLSCVVTLLFSTSFVRRNLKLRRNKAKKSEEMRAESNL